MPEHIINCTEGRQAEVFSCEEAALEVQMSLCPSVCVSVCLCVCYQVEIKPVNRGMYKDGHYN